MNENMLCMHEYDYVLFILYYYKYSCMLMSNTNNIRIQ